MTYEKSLFVKYLGDSPYIRVLDYFIANDIYDCSLQDVADATELSRNTVRKIIKEMLELKIKADKKRGQGKDVPDKQEKRVRKAFNRTRPQPIKAVF